MSLEARRPDVLARLPETSAVHLDVREDILRGREPFTRIMSVVKALGPGQALVLRAPLEPIPLYAALGKRGFAHWTEQRGADDWTVWFYRQSEEPTATGAPASADQLTLDLRGLEPPEPMLRVLERLDTLLPGQSLTVIHDRRPIFLYPQLDARGFLHDTEDLEPGVVHIVIRRADTAPS